MKKLLLLLAILTSYSFCQVQTFNGTLEWGDSLHTFEFGRSHEYIVFIIDSGAANDTVGLQIAADLDDVVDTTWVPVSIKKLSDFANYVDWAVGVSEGYWYQTKVKNIRLNKYYGRKLHYTIFSY